MDDQEKETHADTATLVKRAQAGDREAITLLYKRFEGQVIEEIRQEMGPRLRNNLESVDLAQSLWKDLIRDVQDFKQNGPEAFSRWLHACLRNKVKGKGRYYSAAKRNSDRVRLLADEQSPASRGEIPVAQDSTPSKRIMIQEELYRCIRLLDKLPEIQREVLLLRLRDQLSYEKIGERIGKSCHTARNICGQGLDALRKLLERK